MEDDMATIKKKSIPKRIKLAVRESFFKNYRQPTASRRYLPEFLIIGAMKAGTRSLYGYMMTHPELVKGIRKEIHYFDGGSHPSTDTYSEGETWYRAHFPIQRNSVPAKKAVDATPRYIFNPLTPQRIAESAPTMKLIALLRNPVERAISHYFHEVRMGREKLPLMDALLAEESRLKPAIESEDYKNSDYNHFSYKLRGHYYDQIERYLKHFPRDQMLILESEPFFTAPESTLSQVFEFVGVDPNHQVKNLQPQNVANNKTPIDLEILDYLSDYFRPLNEKLYSLLGVRYGW